MGPAFFFLAIAAAVGLIVYVNRQDQARRLAKLGAVACSVCGAEGVTERGGGSYACGRCGYDTDAEQPPEKAQLLKDIQEIAIALSCLEIADTELTESRHRTVQRTRDGRRTTEHVGPFHANYLEGLEQAEEARRILTRQLDARPALGPVAGALADIPAPADGRSGFNDRVAEAKACLGVARSGASKVRAELVAAFRL